MSYVDYFFSVLEIVDGFFWAYVGFMLVVLSGLYFTLRSKFFQLKVLSEPIKTIKQLSENRDSTHGVHPVKLYFASIGGMIGLGNIVGVITAIMLGGPGALFWLWIASFFGSLIKYAEIFLGIKYRVRNAQGGFDGGSIYFLRKAFNYKWPAVLVSVLLCIYGIEVLQFLVVTDTIVSVCSIERHIVIGLMIGAVLYTGLGGVKRLANVCSVLMPVFVVLYILMGFYVIAVNIDILPGLLKTVFVSAFTGHAAVGGFVGGSFLLAAQQGIARAVYSGDIGIGYDSIIQSETQNPHPERQARLAIFALLTDALVCTMSMGVVLITDIWHLTGIKPSEFVAKAFGFYFPHMEIFMGIILFLAGFTTIIAYYAVGLKSARFLSKKFGPVIYIVYSIFAFAFFSYHDQTKVMLVMSLSGGLLMLINLAGILRLRHEVKFI